MKNHSFWALDLKRRDAAQTARGSHMTSTKPHRPQPLKVKLLVRSQPCNHHNKHKQIP